MIPEVREIASLIDHALLHPSMTCEEVKAGCHLALECEVAAACVKSCDVELAAPVLAGSPVAVCSVVGFPHGNSNSFVKATEALKAIEDGATELDVVVNIGRVKSADWSYLEDELVHVNGAVTSAGAILKLIFETDYLDDQEIIQLCHLATKVGVAFVKTSTGFGFKPQPGGGFNYQGATPHHIALMRKHCGPHVQVKASGGIRTLQDLLIARDHGATRIGMSSTKSVLEEAARYYAAGSQGGFLPQDSQPQGY